MVDGSSAFLFLLLIVMAIGFRLAAGSMDRARISDEVVRRGGKVVSIEWAPFGRGWFGERGDRIYNITFQDPAGVTHRASCKTSLFSGVYWHEENTAGEWRRKSRSPPRPDYRPMGAPPPEDDVEALRRENERLREELRRRG